MANDPRQIPDIDLPGAEYLNMAPGRSIALQGRRHAVASSTATSIAAGGFGAITATAQIESGMTLTSGIYLHVLFGSFIPSDNTGELEIGGLQAGFGINPSVLGDIGFRIGFPTATVLSPIGVSGLITAQDMLIPYQDVVFSSVPGSIGNLGLTLQLTVKNSDPTNPHSASVTAWVFYTRLDGMLYGT